ncbi:alpha-ketoacid dehydrogenase subunit beta [Azospirillum soli]|uniref:alpha-ketoacid dehydrogenase subunit beta n=1 Tax=Azospirillum soli TaxID=1304799 RepID=UPI001AEADD4B|nr:transketolase C-terminal domain-containing protein [Azospirillum soli]MBP2316238.1 pyruvate dehydrogenase E1 component beta subunit [Azospirillum soli]
MSSISENREITYAEALHEATVQEMERDSGVFVFGLGVDDPKGMYGSTRDLHTMFSPDRNFDTPLSEDAMTGVAIGAAMAGMRPIHVHQRMDFLLLCMNQLVNCAAKASYVTAGAVAMPIVVRGIIGRSWGQGAQHSQAVHSMFMHVPGLKVVAPTTPHDAKGCMIAAIRDNNPVIFMEHRMLYQLRGFVPTEAYEVPFGKARVLRKGRDVTIVGISHPILDCLRAANSLDAVGISAEVIDPVSLAPLDIDTIADSVSKTGSLLVVDTSWTNCGASAEIVAQIAERFAGDRAVRLRRLGYAPTSCPTTKPLENAFYPDAASIAQAAFGLLHKGEEWRPLATEAKEITEFRGPF